MNAVTAPLKSGQKGAAVTDLQVALQWLIDRAGVELSDAQKKEFTLLLRRETAALTYGSATAKLVSLFQHVAGLPTTGVVDAATAEAINRRVKDSGGDIAIADAHDAAQEPLALKGIALQQRGQPAVGVKLRLYQLLFDGTEKRLGEAPSEAGGKFAIRFSADAGPLQWQLRLADETPLLRVKVGRPESEPITVVVPDSAVATDDEWTRLVRDVGAMSVGIPTLAALQQSERRSDLSALAAATGWDTRLVALAATAARIGQQSKLAPAAIYALLRLGAAGSDADLWMLAPGTVQQCLTNANANRLVAMTDAEIKAAVASFAGLATQARLKQVPTGLVSSPSDLLGRARISDADKAAFAKALTSMAGSEADLWKTASQSGVSDGGIKILQRQGKLALLTVHNAPLTEELSTLLGESMEVGDLAFHGLAEPSAWTALLDKVAAEQHVAVAALIPATVTGDTEGARKQSYAEAIARQFRVAFPTRTIAAKVLAGDIVAGQTGEEQKLCSQTLARADDAGFVIGRTPVGPFLKKQGDALFAGATQQTRSQQERQLRRLHRLYQMSPDDSSMGVLSTLALDDARKVTTFSRREFLAYAGDRFDVANADRSRFVAERIHAKAQHIDATARAVVTMTQQAVQSSPLTSLGGGQGVSQVAQQAILQAFPTVESLFGNQDYCDCESCRSVLSPAAYLVDLLRYVDPDPTKWQAFLDQWKVEHGGTAYPHVDTGSGNPLTPYDVLMARRPDLAHLELTCDNTNVVLPYVDLVTEILEAYIDGGLTPSPTAYDSEGLATADLISEPQHVNASVYDKLRNEPFPLALPFDLWTVASRAYSAQVDTQYWQLLEALRPDNTMFVDPPGAVAYAGEQILAERLGLTCAEVELLVAAGGATPWRALYGLNRPGDSDASARTALGNAKALASRLAVTQKELTALFKTRFVNPTLATLAALNKLGISVELVCRSKGAPGYPALSASEQTGLQQRLDAVKAETGEDVQQWIDERWNAGDFDRAVLLRTPASGCDPAQIQIALARVNPAGPADALDLTYLRLNLIVRLWRRLSWELPELDDALCLFLPPDTVDSLAKVGPALRVGIVGLAHLSQLSDRLRIGKKARQKVLSFWGDVPNFGSTSLYRQLFLANVSAVDAKVFDSVTGRLLPGTVSLAAQREAVQGALSISAENVVAIFAAARLDLAPGVPLTADNAKLTLPVVSLLYRYALLAQGLKAPLDDVVDLIALTGINPFAPLPAVGTAVANLNAVDAAPGAAATRFVKLYDDLKAAGLAIADLRYWLRHEDATAEARPRTETQIMQALHQLAAAIDQTRADFQVPVDPGLVTSEVLAQRLAVRYPADVAATWVGMLDGSTRFAANVAAASPLIGAADLAGAPDLTGPLKLQANFDAMRDRQQLACTGVMTQAMRDGLATKFPALTPLLDSLRDQAVDLFNTWFKTDLTGVSFETLFDPVRTRAQRYAVVLPLLYPECQHAAEPAAVISGLATLTGVDVARIARLAGDTSVLRDPASPAPPGGAVNLVNALRDAISSGVQASFFANANATGAPSLVVRVATPEVRAYQDSTTLTNPERTAADGAQSVRFEGTFTVPASGTYRFEATAGAANERMTFSLREQAGAAFDATAAQAGELIKGAAVELDAGTAYHYTATLFKRAPTSAAMFSLRGEPVPALQDFGGIDHWSPADVDTVGRCLSALDKAVLAARRVAMTDIELAYVLSSGALGSTTFSDLPTAKVLVDATHPPLAATATQSQLFASLAIYRQLMRDLELPPGTWADVLSASTQTVSGAANDSAARANACDQYASTVSDRLGTTAATVRGALKALALDQTAASSVTAAAAAADRIVTFPALANVTGLRRLIDLVLISSRFGVKADVLQGWAIPKPTATSSLAIRQALKSRYSETDWRQAIKPLADRLRQQRRDALVAYLLNQLGLEVPEQLYERFLVDPGMEPVVQTSRIRLAISSVQRFVDRVLQNYEPDVHPSTLTAEWWPRMGHFPVWAAARQFVLFANWLEPEFRDDQSHLFKAMMGRLLQGNVDRDSVEDAFFEYLQGLDRIARLQFVSAYQEEATDGIIHLIGRTFASPHKYFYRRCEHTVWTPWEPVGVDIEGDHVTAIVWRGRLCLFWLTVIDKSQPNSAASGTSFKTLGDGAVGSPAAQPSHTWDVRLNWSELVNGDWVPRSAANDQHTIRFEPMSAEYQPSLLFTFVAKRYQSGNEVGVEIHVVSSGGVNTSNGTAFLVRSRHAPPEILFSEYDSPVQFRYWSESVGESSLLATQYLNENSRLTAHFHQVFGDDSLATDAPVLQHADLKTFWLLPMSYALPPYHNERADLSVPFFYTDHDNNFFVEPTVDEHSVRQWNHWGIGDDFWRGYAIAKVPKTVGPHFPDVVDSAMVATVDPGSLLDLTPSKDWVTAPGTVVQYGSTSIRGADRIDANVATMADVRRLGTIDRDR
jgi:peptidoglycan hydrolase-like protein with peptidoglycan-binding domain